MMDPITVIKLVDYIMLKKKQLTNRLYPTSGGWAAIRQVNYKGIGHVYGEEYHQISPMVSSGEWEKMLQWMFDTFGACSYEKGPGVWTPHQRWYANNQMFWFKDIKDCEWFLLRWQ